MIKCIEIVALLVGFFLLSCCARKWASYTFLNGYMTQEKADALFPHWRNKQDKIGK